MATVGSGASAALAAARRGTSPFVFRSGEIRAGRFRRGLVSCCCSRKLVLYSKPGCCLCDGLKEKLQAALLLSGPDSLHDVRLLVRDITTNPLWERAYQYEIPVLAKVLPDGTEETLPRLSPRLGVEIVQKKIAAALRDNGVSVQDP